MNSHKKQLKHMTEIMGTLSHNKRRTKILRRIAHAIIV